MRSLLICLVFVLVSAFGAAQDKLVFTIEGRGEFTMTLDQKAAPKTCAQIIGLASRGFYDGQKFHRAIQKPKPFLVQVGDPASKNGSLEEDMNGGSGKKVPFEDGGLPCELGAVGLARNPDDKDSGDSQFFILLAASRFMNGKYTIFARITAGMDVVQKITVGDKISSVRVVKG
jgi:peptidylprolyl isomerase/peptidyl-prolyl cis-trans isomerase B (cyclophilin B)